MTEAPAFFCMKTLGPGDRPRVTLYSGLDDNFRFVLYEHLEVRGATADARCNELAARLTELWEAYRR